jgi:hypothetical protein
MSNKFLTHPQSGGICFGNIAEMNSRGTIIPAGGIRLMSGKHFGANSGWGAIHIWVEHMSEMKDRNFLTYQDVPAYVATIIRQGTPLFFEGGNMRKIRLMGVRAATGIAVLEFRKQRTGPIWSVVTAFSGTKMHGNRVGAVH